MYFLFIHFIGKYFTLFYFGYMINIVLSPYKTSLNFFLLILVNI